MGAETALIMYVQTIDMVTSFQYLGQIRTTTDDDLPEVIINLQKMQQSRAHISRILGWERSDDRTLGRF